ncbi:MAG: hypothetical protein O7H41_14295 [Planctomycetota bacterium]|nr:hypothetical protein [Planctomycetota bacterium]
MGKGICFGETIPPFRIPPCCHQPRSRCDIEIDVGRACGDSMIDPAVQIAVSDYEQVNVAARLSSCKATEKKDKGSLSSNPLIASECL